MSQMYAALNEGFDAGRTAARELADRTDGSSPEALATEAMTRMVQVLHDAGCVREPEPPQVAMTLEDAAALLCRRARTPRLDPDDPADVRAVVDVRTTYEFAWAAVGRAGIASTDTEVHAAQRLLAAHHGLI